MGHNWGHFQTVSRVVCRAGVLASTLFLGGLAHVAHADTYEVDSAGSVLRVHGGTRVWVDGNAIAVQQVSNDVFYLLARDHVLWRDHGDHNHHEWVDATVSTFSAVDEHLCYVVGIDGRKWLDNGTMHDRRPASELEVGGHVRIHGLEFKPLLVGGFGIPNGAEIELDEVAVSQLESAADVAAFIADSIPGIGNAASLAIAAARAQIWAVDVAGGHHGVRIHCALVPDLHHPMPGITITPR